MGSFTQRLRQDDQGESRVKVPPEEQSLFSLIISQRRLAAFFSLCPWRKKVIIRRSRHNAAALIVGMPGCECERSVIGSHYLLKSALAWPDLKRARCESARCTHPSAKSSEM